MSNSSGSSAAPSAYEVDLPAGGKLVLQSQDEVDMWDQSASKYVKDYHLNKANDLVLLGAILSQQLALFRAQQRLNGMVPEFDKAGVPTGRYITTTPSPKDMSVAQGQILKAGGEIRELEKALGIDKKTREAGGQHTVGDYVKSLKRSAHQMGVHISQRTKAYEAFVMELRWKIRVLHNGDDEDRKHHNVTTDSILEWAEKELIKLEAVDKKFAKEKGKVYAGKL